MALLLGFTTDKQHMEAISPYLDCVAHFSAAQACRTMLENLFCHVLRL